jgi:branched-subunit amino acid transport protein
MSDILAVFSIVAVSLAAITIVIRLLPLLMLAALVLLAVWGSFLRNRPQGSLVH